MNVLLLLHAFGSASLFASRVFLPALLTAALLRFGPQLPVVAASGLLAHSGAPLWFTSDLCLGVLIVLSALELLADRVPELRDAATTVEPWLKPALAAATSLGVVQVGDANLAGAVLGMHAATVSSGVAAGVWSGALSGVTQLVVPGVAAATTLGAVQLRAPLLGALRAADPDDALHLQRLWRWLETGWVVAGAVLLVLLPVVVALLLVVGGLGVAVLRRRVQARQDAATAPCSGCGQPVWLAAPHCAGCGAAQAAPRAVGALGQVREAPAPADHAALLLGQLRCPHCASRLRRGAREQACGSCGHAPLRSAAQREAYVAALGARLPQRLLVVLVASLVPVAGYVVAAVWSGLVIESPLRAHLRPGERLRARLWLRMLRLVVVLVQVAPLLGAVIATAEAWVRWAVLRRALLAEAKT